MDYFKVACDITREHAGRDKPWQITCNRCEYTRRYRKEWEVLAAAQNHIPGHQTVVSFLPVEEAK